MTFEQIVSSINSLSPADQVRIVNAIWDRLPDDVGGILPDEETAVLKQRWQQYLADPSSAVSEEEFRTELNERRDR
jgi:putative addiction module component (TIGR02574 family)